MIIFLFWIGFSAALGVAANTRGRSGFGWFFFALVISPVLAVCFLIALPPVKSKDDPFDEAFRERVERWSRSIPEKKS